MSILLSLVQRRLLDREHHRLLISVVDHEVLACFLLLIRDLRVLARQAVLRRLIVHGVALPLKFLRSVYQRVVAVTRLLQSQITIHLRGLQARRAVVGVVFCQFHGVR